MKKIILGILVMVFIFGVVGNCLAGASSTGPYNKPIPTADHPEGH